MRSPCLPSLRRHFGVFEALATWETCSAPLPHCLIALFYVRVIFVFVPLLFLLHLFCGAIQPVSLNDVVNADAIEVTGILDDPAVQEVLVPLLAEGQQNAGELREIVSICVVYSV